MAKIGFETLVQRLPYRLTGDARRTITRFFWPGTERARKIIDRVLNLSQQDIRLTRDLVEAGRHMKVTVHDHVIVGANGRTSMRAMGLI
jgi:hypothetical protein